MADPKSLLFIDGTNLDHRLRAAFGRDDVDFPAFFAAGQKTTENALIPTASLAILTMEYVPALDLYGYRGL